MLSLPTLNLGVYSPNRSRASRSVFGPVELSYVDRNEDNTPVIEIGLILARRPKRTNSDEYVEWEFAAQFEQQGS